MQTPFRNKAKLWISRNRGIKSRITNEVKQSPMERDDIPDVLVANKIKRGGLLQEARLRFYPSIDVDKNKLFAGKINGNLEDAQEHLLSLGFRNNPTAYVEVTDEHGPDDGSFSKQFITEDGGKANIPQVSNQPAFYKRLKEQYHVTVYDVNDEVIFLVHKELSAWLQPARHVWNSDASARLGVRDFRNMWFDEFQEKLPGKSQVMWSSTR